MSKEAKETQAVQEKAAKITTTTLSPSPAPTTTILPSPLSPSPSPLSAVVLPIISTKESLHDFITDKATQFELTSNDINMIDDEYGNYKKDKDKLEIQINNNNKDAIEDLFELGSFKTRLIQYLLLSDDKRTKLTSIMGELTSEKAKKNFNEVLGKLGQSGGYKNDKYYTKYIKYKHKYVTNLNKN